MHWRQIQTVTSQIERRLDDRPRPEDQLNPAVVEQVKLDMSV